jgi:hypothetical protein
MLQSHALPLSKLPPNPRGVGIGGSLRRYSGDSIAGVKSLVTPRSCAAVPDVRLPATLVPLRSDATFDGLTHKRCCVDPLCQVEA